MSRPLIGITSDVAEYDWRGQPRTRAQSAMTYSSAVAAVGGLPVILAPIAKLAKEHAERCDAIVMTGGDDPIMEAFGGVTHPRAHPMHPLRQEYELALLAALDSLHARPVLGICLGMQLMSLHAGGKFNQCLAETLPSHIQHVKDFAHAVVPVVGVTDAQVPIPTGRVASNHRQGVEDAGRLRVTAKSEDGVIEAVEDPKRKFYLGVQWHPERTADPNLGERLFAELVRAAAK